MSNPAKRKGTDWELRVLRHLETAGINVRRMPPAGNLDVGDLHATDGDGDLWVLELKATKALDLAGGLDEARVEATRAGAVLHAAIFKRRNHPTGRGYVVMDLDTFTAVLAAPGRSHGLRKDAA